MRDKLIYTCLTHIITFALYESKDRQDKLDYTSMIFKNKNKYKILKTVPFLLWSFEAHMNTQSKSWSPGKGSSLRYLRNVCAPNNPCVHLHTPPSEQVKNNSTVAFPIRWTNAHLIFTASDPLSHSYLEKMENI